MTERFQTALDEIYLAGPYADEYVNGIGPSARYSLERYFDETDEQCHEAHELDFDEAGHDDHDDDDDE